jgi:hypothetical protein
LEDNVSEQYPDLGITQKQDGDYWDVVIPDLDCSTDYALQVAWIYSDKALGTSEFSDRFNFTTPAPSRVCPSNVSATWDAKAGLNVTWQKNDQRVRNYVISLQAGGYTRSYLIPATGTSLNYSWVLTRENNIFQFGGVFRTSFTSFSIQSVYGDGSSDQCPVTIEPFVDQVCTHTIASTAWNVVGQSNGILVSWQDSGTSYGTYRETRVYVSETPSPYNWELMYTGIGPASIKLDTLNTVYVKLNHLSYSDCESLSSDVKEAKAYDPIVFDDTPPENNFNLGSATVEEDPNGLFNFDKKILFTWTQNTDTSTSGYRIRYKSALDTDYTYMSVPGIGTTSAYLYGLKSGQTYQIAVTTYDVYGNDNSEYKQYPNIVIPSNTSLKEDVAISAGDMKLGYGIGGNNANKGLYVAPENYWYVTGNTNVSSAARFKVGGTNDWMYWDGSSLEVTGTINANAGEFTGSVDIGTASVDGQLRVTTSSGKFEIGKLTNTSGQKIGVGIQGTNSAGKLFQLDTETGIIANKGTIAGWTIDDTSINKAGNVGFYATTTNSDVTIWAGGSRTVSPNFSVTYSGKMVAKDAVLKGMVQAGEGGFGILESDSGTATGYRVANGWTIDSAKIKSTNTSSQVTLDGLQGSIIGGNIVGSNHYFMNPSAWTTAYPGAGSGNPGNVDYISSTGNFRLAGGKLTYDGDVFNVQTDLVASNIFLGSGVSFSNDYLLGKDTTISGTTKAAGSFAIGNGSIVYDKTANSVSINPNGLPYSQFKIRLSVTSNNDGYGGDTTVVQDKDGYLTTGRAFHYGGANLPNGATSRIVGGVSVDFNPGDIWLSRI